MVRTFLTKTTDAPEVSVSASIRLLHKSWFFMRLFHDPERCVSGLFSKQTTTSVGLSASDQFFITNRILLPTTIFLWQI